MTQKPTYDQLLEKIRGLEQEKAHLIETIDSPESDFHAFFQNTMDCALVLDENGGFLKANDACCATTGYDIKILLSMSLADLETKNNPQKILERLALAGEKGRIRYETRHIRADGRFMEAEVSLIHLSNKKRYFCQIRDITRQKLAQEELRCSEERLRKAQSLAKVGGWEWNVETRTMTWSEETYRLHGISPEAFQKGAPRLMEQSLKCFRPEDRPAILEAFRLCAEKGRPYDLRLPFFSMDGRSLYTRTTAEPVVKNGKIIGVMGNIMDITDQQHMEQTLQVVAESGAASGSELYRFLVKALALSQSLKYAVLIKIHASDPHTGHAIAVWNGSGFYENFSFQLLGTPWLEVLEKGPCFYPDMLHTRFPGDPFIQKMNADSFWGIPLQDSNHHIPGILAVLDTGPMRKSKDTLSLLSSFGARAAAEMENRRTMNTLKERERSYRLLFHNLSSAFSLHEVLRDKSGACEDFRFLEVNPAFERLTGLFSKTVIGKTIKELNPNPEKDWSEVYGQVVETKKPVSFEHSSREMDRQFEVIIYSPEPDRVASVFRDITEQKKVREDVQKLAEAVRQAYESIAMTLPDGAIVYVNPAFEQYTGYTQKEVIGKNPRFLKSGRQNRFFYENMWKTILSGNRWTGRLVNKRKDNSLYTAECSISPVIGPNGRIVNFVWISRDITIETELEKRMAQAERMDAIGALAGGIAHDFNNILFPIIGFSDFLIQDLQPGSMERESALEIRKAAVRAGDLVKQILTFSRQTEQKKIPLQIQPILKESLKLARSTIPASIRITQDIQGECGPIDADPTRIHQIIMNLLTNAFHAVESVGGGHISVALSQKSLSPGDSGLSVLNLKPGNYACITIADTGVGIDEEIIHKIFDPYFTTKKKGKGTGLGLSMVHGIVKEYGGEIRVQSKKGKGTRFDVYLHISRKKSREKETTEPDRNLGTGEKILLVDDESPIVRMLWNMLERYGYEVFSHVDSRKALETFKSDPNGFDLVITDLAMPHMNGEILVKKIREIRPDTPIILCTGFSDEIDEEKARKMGVRRLMHKPVIPDDLRTTVRQILDQMRVVKNNKIS